MSSEIAIQIDNLSKCYHIYEKPRDRLFQMLTFGRKKFFREFWALNNVTFQVEKGETVGIIGKNGSGKSTLLQMICGTINPTSGSVLVNGRVAALLELGAGFNPEFTGKENVFLSASLYGLSKEEIEECFNKITDFADIGDFIDQPLKTYSSGMFVRLAFAVIAHVNADILVVDEALSVGDAYFVQKCMRYLREFMKNGTLLFCSHDISAIVNLCSSAILLKNGHMEMMGKPKVIAECYLAALYESVQGESNLSQEKKIQDEKNLIHTRAYEYKDVRESLINSSILRNDIEVFRFNPDNAAFGTGAAEITSVKLLDEVGVPLSWVVGGCKVILEIGGSSNKKLIKPIIGFHFKDRLGQVLFADNTYLTYIFDENVIDEGKEFIARFSFTMPILATGSYSISPSIAEGTQDDHVQHHWIHDALILQVHASSVCFGVFAVPMQRITLNII